MIEVSSVDIRALEYDLMILELEFYKYYYDNYFNNELVRNDKKYFEMVEEIRDLKNEILILEGGFDEEEII